MLKKVLSNTIANYALKFIQIILNLVAIPVLVNGIGEESFGILLFAGVVVGYFNILDLGLANGVTKYVAQYLAEKNYERVQDIINTTLNFFIGIGFFVGILISLWAYLGGVEWLNFNIDKTQTYANVFFIAGVIAIFSWPQMLLKGVFSGIQDFVTLNLTIGIGRILSVGLAIVTVLYTDLDLEYVFLLFNLDKIVLTFWQYILLSKKLSFWKFKIFDFNSSIFRSIFTFSGWIMLGQIAVLLEYQADQLIIIGFLTASEITTYTVVFYLFRLIQQISGLAASAVMPAISYLNEIKGKEGVDAYIYKGVKYHNLLFVPIVITCFFLAEPFVKLWMGERYLDYVWLIQLSIIFQLIWQSGAMLGQIYTGMGFSRKPGIIAIIIGVLNVITSIILVSIIGVEGVILGTIIVGVLSVPVAMWWMLPDLKVDFFDYYLNVVGKAQFPLILTGGILYLASDWFYSIDSWIVLGLSAGLITSVLYIVGIFTVFDKADVIIMKKRFLNFSK